MVFRKWWRNGMKSRLSKICTALIRDVPEPTEIRIISRMLAMDYIIMGSVNPFEKSEHLQVFPKAQFVILWLKIWSCISWISMKLYIKRTISQNLNERQIWNRLAFCRRVKGMVDNFELDMNEIIFSHESRIYLDGMPKHQNLGLIQARLRFSETSLRKASDNVVRN